MRVFASKKTGSSGHHFLRMSSRDKEVSHKQGAGRKEHAGQTQDDQQRPVRSGGG